MTQSAAGAEVDPAQVEAIVAQAEQELAGAAGTAHQDPLSDPGAEQAKLGSHVSGKIKVKYGDAIREIPVEELVDSHLKRSQADELAKVARSLMQRNTVGESILQVMDKMTPPQRAALQRFLADPSQLDRGAEPEDDPAGDLEALLNGNGRNGNGGDEDAKDRLLRTLAQSHQAILNRLSQQDQQTQAQTLRQKIQGEMQHYDVFSTPVEGFDPQWAFENIVNEYAQKGGAVEDIVAKHAGKASLMTQGMAKQLLRDQTGRFVRADGLPSPEKATTGADLMNGNIKRLMHDAWVKQGR